ncbi:MAG: DUF1501 domain-containing protein [Planctomycetota bacterium]
MDVSRRTFLLGGLAVPAAAALPSFLLRAAAAAPPSDRGLVLLRLAGGNDGLNTVVPFEQDAYHRARPGLGISGGAVLRLQDGIGLHPGLGGLRPAWEAGDLAVVQGVGYANPNRSHFISTDIWHTASLEPQSRRTGWAGRALDEREGSFGEALPALHLGPEPLSLALVGERVIVPSVRDARRFEVRGGPEAARLLAGLASGPRGTETLEFIRSSARRAYRTADRLRAALAGSGDAAGYPDTPLGRRLWQIARLIEGGLGAGLYAATLDGFDTHSQQKPVHDALMRTLGDAVGALYADLQRAGWADRVVVLTYSEFGRRVKENRSLGTDHGAAAPLFVVGGRVRGGLHGEHPSFSDLRDGDLVHGFDFRRVYATMLGRWIGVDPDKVLGGRYEPVGFL